MGLPLSTTTVTVKRRPTAGDAFDRPAHATIRTGLRATIGGQTGTETNGDGTSSQVTARLVCDPYDLHHDDLIVDDTTLLTWEVLWVARRTALGVDHTAADLLLVTDRAAAS